MVFGFIRKLREKVVARKLRENSGVGDSVGEEVLETKLKILRRLISQLIEKVVLKNSFLLKKRMTLMQRFCSVWFFSPLLRL